MKCPRCGRTDIYELIGSGTSALWSCHCGQAFRINVGEAASA